jgi:hypothetical protein
MALNVDSWKSAALIWTWPRATDIARTDVQGIELVEVA